ncbi:hypothetical protein [Jiella pacifica]|uniref:Uncharacterized protein n=1 Tax=Jiella pacifica TaxID=2696469 RepID=A0A6N9SZL3_9HYPH|nr:hypothetical protein [Jiella pacifica]NDW03149.1 hypothetical protein [Jiella pacifica]
MASPTDVFDERRVGVAGRGRPYIGDAANAVLAWLKGVVAVIRAAIASLFGDLEPSGHRSMSL